MYDLIDKAEEKKWEVNPGQLKRESGAACLGGFGGSFDFLCFLFIRGRVEKP